MNKWIEYTLSKELVQITNNDTTKLLNTFRHQTELGLEIKGRTQLLGLTCPLLDFVKYLPRIESEVFVSLPL